MTRFSECVFVADGQLRFFEGDEIGTATLQMIRQMTLNVRSNSWHEDITMKVLSVTGPAIGVTFTGLTATCGGTCTATVTFPSGGVLADGDVFEGGIDYTDTTTTQNTTQTTYVLDFTDPIPVEPIELTSAPYRCDREIGAFPGCVFPGYTPTMTSMQSLPDIRQNIARIQAAGPHHYGSETLSGGKYPLHRTTNTQIWRANRAAACGGRLNPLPIITSCDEYPFARTLEGASRTTQPDWGYAFVPAIEQGAQAGLISTFVQNERVLDGDA